MLLRFFCHPVAHGVGHAVRKAVYQVRLKIVYLATETSKNIKILPEASLDIKLFGE